MTVIGTPNAPKMQEISRGIGTTYFHCDDARLFTSHTIFGDPVGKQTTTTGR